MKRTDHETFSAVFARREAMLERDEVTAMLLLNKLGLGKPTYCARVWLLAYNGTALYRRRRLAAIQKWTLGR